MARRESSEVEILREERRSQHFSFSISPFTTGGEENEGIGHREGPEIEPTVRAPDEVPWTDLLLEISMTTAFASLTDGTPILKTRAALSYVCYFAFVWWIWVSQVAYNMRFRQADILHRIWVFLQLTVFCALAAFTKDFDITSGLVPDNEQNETQALIAGMDERAAGAFRYRQDRLPLLNARGVSMVMALSRLLLLAQYLVVCYHARKLKRDALQAHIFSLTFSFLCYLGIFIALGHNDIDWEAVATSRTLAIVKVIFWYIPVLAEAISHYVALHMSGSVEYSPTAIFDRAGTLFLIILGAGLDKITGGLKSIIGNGGLGWDGAPLFLAASVLFIGFFALYFATPGTGSAHGRKRLLTWFFAQFLFLSALIITLQGIATLLQFANLNKRILENRDTLQPLFDFINTHPNQSVTASDFMDSELLFRKLGTSLDSIVDVLNTGITYENQLNHPGALHRTELKLEVWLLNNVLWHLGSQPDYNSLLAIKLHIFINADLDNTTELSDAKFWAIQDAVIRDRGSSGLWFYPAAGSTILALGLLSLIRGSPRDQWEWWIVIVRAVVGSITILFGLLNAGFAKHIYDEAGGLTDSRIWRLIVSPRHLQLVLMAVVMAILLLFEFTIAYLAKQSYLTFPGAGFHGLAGRLSARTALNSPAIPMVPLDPRKPLDPYYDQDFDPYREFRGTPFPASS